MGFLEDLFGTGSSESSETTEMTEKDFALDMLKDSKFNLNARAMAITETANPQLREVLKQQFNAVVQDHFKLVDLSVQNDWYLPRLAPNEQIQRDYEEAETLTQ